MKTKEEDHMHKLNLGLAVAAAALLVLGLNAPVLAFHDGNVAHCDGCHTMHYSVDGAQPTFRDGVTVGTPNSNLTIGSDPSSTCLNCHNGSGSYHVNSTDGSNFTPGGDFFWVRTTFEYQSHGAVVSKGENHGHSIIAADFPDFAMGDQTLTQAPGGNYPSAALGCSSCHDPHGKKANKTLPISGSGSYGGTPTAGTEFGNYRLLADLGYETATLTFNGAMPVAVAPSLGSAESDTNHADYGSSMSEWCANCHTSFLVPANNTKHTNGNNAKLGSEFVGNYNTYASTGNVNGPVTQGDAYFFLVPVERGTTDTTQLAAGNTFGANAQSNVSCLTCHRAHASAFDNGTRWDMTTEFLAESHPDDSTTNDQGVAPATLKTNSYYGVDIATQYGEWQRSLCNKCHFKD
jgi:hypothetical protein